MTACIVGWAHVPFGKIEGADIESLFASVVGDAIADAGVEARDIDSVHVGVFDHGFQKQDFVSSLVMQSEEALRFKPATRVENACATGSAAVHAAIDRIGAGKSRISLVVGAEKMTDSSPAERDRPAGSVSPLIASTSRAR